ncbi:hypothetical protein FZC76_17375 [Sutcliffiella horikoshii]|uniref:Uncharacterized protein n=1 Tax=Sutcliffiella horikoshii TaxID=79883 RepID=A0A5D4STZ2_9BACI|nr:hypothetical protein FZC76_17375 [Sutcliffiella horikoshii]
MRPLKRCEEAQAPSRGKRSHLRKGTAVINQKRMSYTKRTLFIRFIFSLYLSHLQRLALIG